MTMGQRIREARLASGLSQRQLAGEEMTRNMLSALENDSANPSVSTLRYLSEKLNRPVGYFLGEESTQDSGCMEQARAAYRSGDWKDCLKFLESVEDEIFASERELLTQLALLGQTRQELERGNLPYARSLLARISSESLYEGLYRQEYWLLMAQCAANEEDLQRAVGQFADADRMLLLRAEESLSRREFTRAAQLLYAAEDRESAGWNTLMGKTLLEQKSFDKALECFLKVERTGFGEVDRELEICYRELGDFKNAYFYATKKR